MRNVVLVVEFDVKPDARDQFIALMRDHGGKCLKNEEGCLQFDVLVPREDRGKVLLLEVYRDQAALEEHMGTDQLARTRDVYKDLITNRRITICER